MRLRHAPTSFQLFRPFRTIFTPKACRLHTKVYSPGSITETLRKQPESLSSLNHIVIGQARQLVEGEHIYHVPDPWNLAHVLQSLESIPSVSRITVDINHVKYHKAVAKTMKSCRRTNFVGEILEEAEIYDFEATDLCHWTSEKWPKVNVQHFPTQYWLQEIRAHIGDPKPWGGFIHRHLNQIRTHKWGPDRWERFILWHRRNPGFQSFAYTADFSSRDVRKRGNGGENVDLGPWRAGEYLFDLCFLSNHFAQAMDLNIAFYETHSVGYWRYDLYDRLRDRNKWLTNSIDLKGLNSLNSLRRVNWNS